MELRHLQYFVAVIDERTFTAAAAACHVAQPALSQQIARLEAELGIEVFHRTSRSVQLTEAGRVLEPFARSLLSTAELAVAEVDALIGLQRGHLRLGLVQTPTSPLDTIGLLGGFHQAYPGVVLEVTNAGSYEMLAAVQAGTLDVAIVGMPVRDLPSAVSAVTLSVDPLVALVPVSSPLAERTRVEIQEVLAAHRLIHFAPRSGLRHQVDAAIARAGARADVVVELSLITDMPALAAAGIGATVVPAGTARRLAPEVGARLHTLRLADPEAVHEISVIADPTRLSPAARLFRRWAIDAASAVATPPH